uniref:NUMOD3 domain-containing DNA-binding protein n=1 Tax=Priestia megaterium TaxID=1404 RepID=UPI0035C6C320
MGQSFDKENEREKALKGEKNHFFGNRHIEDVKKKSVKRERTPLLFSQRRSEEGLVKLV